MKKTNTLIELPELELDGDNRLPNPDEISYYKLEKERRVFLDYDVDEDLMALERLILLWNIEDSGKEPAERKPIKIYIHSYGGHADYMWGLVDVIEASKTPVYTINVGRCCSAASLIFMAGHKRIMMKRAKVLIHEGQAAMSGDSTKVLDASDSYRKELKAMKEYILERTKISKTLLNKKRNNDWELDSAFCLENGVCDQVISTLDEII